MANVTDGVGSMKVGLGALFVFAIALVFAFGRQGRVHRVVYAFPEGFQGEWFLIPDPRLPKRPVGGTNTVRIDRRGLGRVDPATYEAMDGWSARTGRLGPKDIDLAQPADLENGKVSFTLSRETASEPEVAQVAPTYQRGFVGDRRDFQRPRNERSPMLLFPDLFEPRRGVGPDRSGR